MAVLTAAIACLLLLLAPDHAHGGTVTDALDRARLAEPLLAARVLTQTLRLDADGAWLADLEAFDADERAEMFAALRGEGVALADRSKLRRLASGGGAQPVFIGNSSSRRSAQTSSEEGSVEEGSGGASLEAMAIAVTALLGIVSYVVQV
jgi:hypothetical protein